MFGIGSTLGMVVLSGLLGWQIARHLSGERNDVTVVDNNPDLVRRATDTLDVQAVLNYHDQTAEWVGDQDATAVTAIFAGERNTFDNLSGEFRAVTRLDQPVNFVLGAYLQETDRYFSQVVNFAGAAFFGVGGYTAAVLASHTGLPHLLVIGVAGLLMARRRRA